MKNRGKLVGVLAVGLLSAGSAHVAPASPVSDVPLEPGFVIAPFAATQGNPTSLAFGPDTHEGAGEDAKLLYVADSLAGTVLTIDELGASTVFAEGFRSPLGVLATPDGSVYVADAEAAREGPFGLRSYGRVWRVRDTDGDGVGDEQEVVLKDIPNGRHNTNGMAIGPDGLLYIANGNSTDDGVEGGESEVVPWSGSLIRIKPNLTETSVVDLPRSALVAHGWRNVYDVAFSPIDPTIAFIPMNGTDDARKGSTGENPADPNLEDSDDLLFATDVNDKRVDDFGFPSCLYNVAEKGDLRPYENPNPDVVDKFGRCPIRSVPNPVSSFGLHPSANGMAFQTSDAWGDDYRNDLFVTEWGSLFGNPSGHKIVRVELDETGTKVVSQSDFALLDFPLDLTFDDSGTMYVADWSGTIFTIRSVP